MTPPLLLAPALRAGDTIGIVAPGRRPDPAWVAQTAHRLQQAGFGVRVHPQVSATQGQLAGDDALRASAINEFAADPNIRAIIANGGTATARTLDAIDWALLAAQPKLWVGFSDFTAFLNVLTTRTGLVTFHGPMCWNLANNFPDENLQQMLAMLTGQTRTVRMSGQALHVGQTQARLMGGNLTLLCNLLGTCYQPAFAGAALIIEDVDELFYRLAEKLWQLSHTPDWASVAAVLAGELVDCPDTKWSGENPPTPFGRSWPTLLQAALPPSTPLAIDLPLGHGQRLQTLPLGLPLSIEVGQTATTLTLASPAVQL